MFKYSSNRDMFPSIFPSVSIKIDSSNEDNFFCLVANPSLTAVTVGYFVLVTSAVKLFCLFEMFSLLSKAVCKLVILLI